jgi:hypothetical protein
MDETKLMHMISSSVQYTFPMGTPQESRRKLILLTRLATNNLLFLEQTFRSQNKSLDDILPIGKISNFHRFFIQFSIDHDLYGLFLEYVNHYQLKIEGVELGLRMDKNWTNILVRIREKKDLYNASLMNAGRVMGLSTTPSVQTIFRWIFGYSLIFLLVFKKE